MNLNKDWEERAAEIVKEEPVKLKAILKSASEMQEAVLKVLDEYMIVPEALKDLIKNIKPNK